MQLAGLHLSVQRSQDFLLNSAYRASCNNEFCMSCSPRGWWLQKTKRPPGPPAHLVSFGEHSTNIYNKRLFGATKITNLMHVYELVKNCIPITSLMDQYSSQVDIYIYIYPCHCWCCTTHLTPEVFRRSPQMTRRPPADEPPRSRGG